MTARVLWLLAFALAAIARADSSVQVLRFRSAEKGNPFPVRSELPARSIAEASKSFDRFLDIETSTSSPLFVVRLRLSQSEALWGFGERFEAWNQRGRVVESWARDMAQGGPDSSYFAVPFLISSEGYGLFVNSTGRVRFDCGASRRDELRIEFSDAGMDVFVFRGSPRQIVQEYTKLVGRPPPPPEWVFQPWISRNSYMSAAEIEEVITKMEQHGLRAVGSPGTELEFAL